MEITWYGQSSFALRAEGAEIFIDPFGTVEAPAWKYPAISGVSPDLLLVTHEHVDHNGVEFIDGEPHLVRSLAGVFETPLGDVVGVSAEHDPAAGTERGWTGMYVFEFDGQRIAHLGDLGQNELRPEQVEAIGKPDILFVPVGGSATMDGEQARRVVDQLGPRIAIPMHYRTELLDFLEPADSFLSRFDQVEKLETETIAASDLVGSDGATTAVVPAIPKADR